MGTHTLIGRKVKQALKSCFFLLLLTLYVVGNTDIEFIHAAVHSPEAAVSHLSEQENDSCHRAIYHGDRDHGCDHKTHVSKVEKCNLCHLVVTSDQALFSDSSCQFIASLSSVVKYAGVDHATSISPAIPARAPPVA